ncbi:MAG TPA: hypothetical protein VM286_03380 [Candidatus Thermoplasmatota archaeon]|nr:hypothetical protein [Candidatus Thermoplasmatota archaeon]
MKEAQGGPGGPRPGRGARPVAPVLLLLAALLLVSLLPAAAAHEEAEAGLLRSDVLEVRHEPARVEPHTQWQGVLVLRPGHPVVSAQYQVCRVGQSCFAPPAPAQRHGDTFTFDTSNYTVDGHPVDYQAGWRIGVQWILTERTTQDGNGTQAVVFPQGRDLSGPACAADPLACQETHYLAFDMPAAPKASPGAGIPTLLATLLLALLAGRARRLHA